MKHEEEIWRPVVGFESAYEVSNLGRVRSLDRSWKQLSRHGKEYVHRRKGRVLRPGPSNYGHLSVVLGRGNTRMVHALVLEAFRGPRPSPKHDSRHINGDPADNRLDNLVWGTRSENIRDAVAHGSWFSEKRKAHLATFKNRMDAAKQIKRQREASK